MKNDLQGNLAVFRPELLCQMMQLGAADGLLTLKRAGKRVRIYFEKGKLVFADRDLRPPRLGDGLVEKGVIDADDLQQAVQVWRKSKAKKRLGTILVDRGAITRSELEEAIRERIKEAMYQAVSWDEGSFAFESGVHADDEDVLLDVGLETILLDSLGRLDQARRKQGVAERA